MPRSYRWLLVVSVALLLAGVGGALTHRATSRSGLPVSPAAAAPVQPTTTSVASVPGATSATLAAGLITPTDMGGYYRVVPAAASGLLDSAPCLAPLQASGTQSGRAATALLGPNRSSVPTIVEVVASYPSGQAGPVYRSIVSAVGACRAIGFDFGGASVSVPLRVQPIPAVGDSDETWSGSFSTLGRNFTLQLGEVLQGRTVISLVWIDAVPPSPAIEGRFVSTLSLAIGKLA